VKKTKDNRRERIMEERELDDFLRSLECACDKTEFMKQIKTEGFDPKDLFPWEEEEI